MTLFVNPLIEGGSFTAYQCKLTSDKQRVTNMFNNYNRASFVIDAGLPIIGLISPNAFPLLN